MQRQAPAGDIGNIYDQVEYEAVVFSIRIWDCGHDGSMWFHLIVVINITSGSGNINTTIQTTDG